MKLRHLTIMFILATSATMQVHSMMPQHEYYHYIPQFQFINKIDALRAIHNVFLTLQKQRAVKIESARNIKADRKWLAQYDNPDYTKGSNAQFFIYGNTKNPTLILDMQNRLREIEGIALFDPVPHKGTSSTLARSEPKGTIIGEYLNPEGESFQIYFIGGVYAKKNNGGNNHS